MYVIEHTHHPSLMSTQPHSHRACGVSTSEMQRPLLSPSARSSPSAGVPSRVMLPMLPRRRCWLSAESAAGFRAAGASAQPDCASSAVSVRSTCECVVFPKYAGGHKAVEAKTTCDVIRVLASNTAHLQAVAGGNVPEPDLAVACSYVHEWRALRCSGATTTEGEAQASSRSSCNRHSVDRAPERDRAGCSVRFSSSENQLRRQIGMQASGFIAHLAGCCQLLARTRNRTSHRRRWPRLVPSSSQCCPDGSLTTC